MLMAFFDELIDLECIWLVDWIRLCLVDKLVTWDID